MVMKLVPLLTKLHLEVSFFVMYSGKKIKNLSAKKRSLHKSEGGMKWARAVAGKKTKCPLFFGCSL